MILVFRTNTVQVQNRKMFTITSFSTLDLWQVYLHYADDTCYVNTKKKAWGDFLWDYEMSATQFKNIKAVRSRSKMDYDWKFTTFLLCCYGFFKEIRPSEPFLTEYLISNHTGVTEDQVRFNALKCKLELYVRCTMMSTQYGPIHT